MSRKVCNTCGESLPLSAFSPDKRASQGVRGRCKACTSEQTRWRRWSRRPDVPAEKKCATCGKVKPAKDFWRDNGATSGLQSDCVACWKHKYGGRYKSVNARLAARDRKK